MTDAAVAGGVRRPRRTPRPSRGRSSRRCRRGSRSRSGSVARPARRTARCWSPPAARWSELLAERAVALPPVDADAARGLVARLRLVEPARGPPRPPGGRHRRAGRGGGRLLPAGPRARRPCSRRSTSTARGPPRRRRGRRRTGRSRATLAGLVRGGSAGGLGERAGRSGRGPAGCGRARRTGRGPRSVTSTTSVAPVDGEVGGGPRDAGAPHHPVTAGGRDDGAGDRRRPAVSSGPEDRQVVGGVVDGGGPRLAQPEVGGGRERASAIRARTLS